MHSNNSSFDSNFLDDDTNNINNNNNYNDFNDFNNISFSSLPPINNNNCYSNTTKVLFCKDFICCNEILTNLNDLLSHYELFHWNSYLINNNNLKKKFKPKLIIPFNNNNNNTTNSSISLNELFPNTNLPITPQNSITTTNLLLSNSSPYTINTLLINPFQLNNSKSYKSLFKPIQNSKDIQISIDEANKIKNNDKPFICPIINCHKKYKNQNGLKYHKRHGHINDYLEKNSNGDLFLSNHNNITSLSPSNNCIVKKTKKKNKIIKNNLISVNCNSCSNFFDNNNDLKKHLKNCEKKKKKNKKIKKNSIPKTMSFFVNNNCK